MATLGSSTANLTDVTSTSLGGTVGGAGLVQAAYDRMVEFALRATPLIRAVADKRPAKQAMPGSSVALQIYKDLAQKTTTLTESQDVDTISLATPNIVSVSLLEYGNAALTTRKLDLFSLADVDPAVANIIAYNMADSLDEVAQTELLTGTNVLYSDATALNTASLNAGDTIKAVNIRTAIAKLRANKAIPRKGQYFWCGIHPEVSIDLRSEGTGTANANWRDPHVYADSQNEIWAGEIGAFEGAYFVESPRLRSALDGKAQTPVSATIALTTTSGIQTATVTQAAHGYSTGDWVTIAGVTTDTFFNTDWQITVTGTGTYTLNKSDATFGIADKSLTGTITAAKKTRVYRTFLAGQQALAEAVAEEPHVVVGPVVDRLMRFRPIGWYGVLGFKVYRNEALYRIESTSSIGSNVA